MGKAHFLFYILMTATTGYGSPQARDAIRAIPVTSATRSLTHCTRLGIELALPQRQPRWLTYCATKGIPAVDILSNKTYAI